MSNATGHVTSQAGQPTICTEYETLLANLLSTNIKGNAMQPNTRNAHFICLWWWRLFWEEPASLFSFRMLSICIHGLLSIQDVYGETDDNKQWPGSDITLASCWSKARGSRATYFAFLPSFLPTKVNLIAASSHELRLKHRPVIVVHTSLSCSCSSSVYFRSKHPEQSTEEIQKTEH